MIFLDFKKPFFLKIKKLSSYVLIFVFLQSLTINKLQSQSYNANQIKYDSVIVQKIYDSKTQVNEFNQQHKDTFYIIAKAKLSPIDATNLTKRIFRKNSYGNSNYAHMVIPEIEIIYYYEGKPIQKIQVELTANYFFPSFDVKQQQRGKHLIGSFYEKSGIKKGFKSYLFNLFIQYRIMQKDDDVFFFDKKE